jgi:hypothetical protein
MQYYNNNNNNNNKDILDSFGDQSPPQKWSPKLPKISREYRFNP